MWNNVFINMTTQMVENKVVVFEGMDRKTLSIFNEQVFHLGANGINLPFPFILSPLCNIFSCQFLFESFLI